MESRKTLERYMYTILLLKKKHRCVRSIDVAKYLNCSKPSVSKIVSRLICSGFLVMEQNGSLVLTDQGQEHMQGYQQRGCYFQQLLQDAGVSTEAAEQEAFSLAVAIRPDTFESLKEFLPVQVP